MRNCADEPSEEMLHAVELFNSGEWYETHHVLDRLYMEERGEVRFFYQAVIQIGAAMIHWQRGNYEGAVALLDRGALNLGEVRPICQGVNVAELARGARRLRDALQALGPERMGELDRAAIPTLQLVKQRTQ